LGVGLDGGWFGCYCVLQDK